MKFSPLHADNANSNLQWIRFGADFAMQLPAASGMGHVTVTITKDASSGKWKAETFEANDRRVVRKLVPGLFEDSEHAQRGVDTYLKSKYPVQHMMYHKFRKFSDKWDDEIASPKQIQLLKSLLGSAADRMEHLETMSKRAVGEWITQLMLRRELRRLRNPSTIETIEINGKSVKFPSEAELARADAIRNAQRKKFMKMPWMT
jgi:hypothetical protein